ncbi:hypothetical protein SAMN05661096_00101 [Marivirga sericea]|uniref:Uncharacterized protein n=1 Tax=Marivirga sericea TaxID=1028 RepID=A0A1X7I0U6_9BACT|nr:hypothetical protein [Marivirga sericea]SMG07955.1 hypothetical protein SAMN05661096_00101 [Marivirga sericea]
MKRNYFIIVLITCFYLVGCSAEDDLIEKENIKIFKKVERYRDGLFFDKVINYDSDNRIESIVANKYMGGAAPFERVVSVAYSESTVSTITDAYDYEDPNDTDTEITYNVSSNDNTIDLISDDVEIEIAHSNGFVDAIITNYGGSYIDTTFLSRDLNQNLIAVTFNNRAVVNRYSNFDTDKKTDPDGIVVEVIHRDILRILGLKLTENNPSTSSQTILEAPSVVKSYTYEYDEEGYITRTYDENLIFYTDTFYIEE